MNTTFNLDTEISKLNTPERYNSNKQRYDYSEADIIKLFEDANKPDKIELIVFAIAKDGGTKKCIEKSVKESLKTIDDLRNVKYYYIDGRIGSNTRGELYDRYPSDAGATILDKNLFNILDIRKK